MVQTDHRYLMSGLLEGWDWFDNGLQNLGEVGRLPAAEQVAIDDGALCVGRIAQAERDCPQDATFAAGHPAYRQSVDRTESTCCAGRSQRRSVRNPGIRQRLARASLLCAGRDLQARIRVAVPHRARRLRRAAAHSEARLGPDCLGRAGSRRSGKTGAQAGWAEKEARGQARKTGKSAREGAFGSRELTRCATCAQLGHKHCATRPCADRHPPHIAANPRIRKSPWRRKRLDEKETRHA